MLRTFLEAAAQRSADLAARTDADDLLDAAHTIVDLPHTLLDLILSFLPFTSLAVASSTSRAFGSSLANAATSRKQRLQLHVPTAAAGEPLLAPFIFAELSLLQRERMPFTIAAAEKHSLLCVCSQSCYDHLHPAGTVLTWGTSARETLAQPTPVGGFSAGVVRTISAGLSVNAAVTATGAAYSWGYSGSTGALGLATLPDGAEAVREALLPRRVLALQHEVIVQVACGERHVR